MFTDELIERLSSQLMEITAQYSDDRQLVQMQATGAPWGMKSIDTGLELVDERLNEVVVLCQNCGAAATPGQTHICGRAV